MSMECWTWIRTGGAVERSRVEPLLPAIRKARVGLEWDVLFAPADPEDLLEARQGGRLWLCDSESRDGDLRGMEEVCQHMGLPYRQHIEGCCGNGAALIALGPA